MEENSTIEYPESHPKATELKVLKEKINEIHKELEENRVKAREAYIEASKCTIKISELQKQLADSFRELEAKAVEPLV